MTSLNRSQCYRKISFYRDSLRLTCICIHTAWNINRNDKGICIIHKSNYFCFFSRDFAVNTCANQCINKYVCFLEIRKYFFRFFYQDNGNSHFFYYMFVRQRGFTHMFFISHEQNRHICTVPVSITGNNKSVASVISCSAKNDRLGIFPNNPFIHKRGQGRPGIFHQYIFGKPPYFHGLSIQLFRFFRRCYYHDFASITTTAAAMPSS